MTTKEVAEYLRIHEITVGKYAAEGLIPSVRIGRVWRFDKNRIDEWIANGCSAGNGGKNGNGRKKRKG